MIDRASYRNRAHPFGTIENYHYEPVLASGSSQYLTLKSLIIKQTKSFPIDWALVDHHYRSKAHTR
jgi:hypothetical protein